MKHLTAEDLLSLEYGDTVYLRNEYRLTKFRYVGRMPSSERYLIFSCGENLKHLFMRKDGTFLGEWLGGEYDDEFVINLRIKELEKELENLRSELTIKNETDEN